MHARRVLVIDDSTTLRKVVEIAMRGSGYEVELAANGHEGVALARRRRPDVILLDYLLPDLRSTEVCQRLADDPATAAVPVIIMSANQRAVLDEFRCFASVAGFVGKPFTAPEIRGRLEDAVRGAPAAAVSDGSAPREREAASLDTELQLRGNLAVTPLLEVLRLLVATHATGALVVVERGDAGASAAAGSQASRGDRSSGGAGSQASRGDSSSGGAGGHARGGDSTARLWLRRGEILLASTTRDRGHVPPPSDLRSSISELRELTPELRERVARNLASGKPALVTLAEAGAARAANLPLELHAASARLIADLLAARAGSFAWEASALPEFVEAFGRHVSITALALDQARRTTAGARSEGALERVYDRTPRFSHKLAGAQLEAAEQRVLGLIDGRSTGRELAARGGLSLESAAAILIRLSAADLIQHGEVSQIAGGRTLAVLDADRDDLIAPLRTRLACRPQPIDVVELDPARSLAAATLASRADVILVNAVALTRHVLEHELPAIARAGGTAVVCVLDAPNPGLASQMLQAGLHAVISKPVHLSEIERLLSVT